LLQLQLQLCLSSISAATVKKYENMKKNFSKFLLEMIITLIEIMFSNVKVSKLNIFSTCHCFSYAKILIFAYTSHNDAAAAATAAAKCCIQ